jgi:halocyanin-like protein
MNDSAFSRRRFLAATGSTALVAGLAGCSGGGDGGDDPGGTDTGTGTDTETATEASMGGGDYTQDEQRVADFLQAEPAEGTFDGEFIDATDQDSVSVKVGGDGNDGAFAFAPVAFKITTGTTISWEWTGEGGQHNVKSAEPSDYEFTSGDPKQSGDPYTQSFDEVGVGLYVCEPHRSLGMKGGFVVVE